VSEGTALGYGFAAQGSVRFARSARDRQSGVRPVSLLESATLAAIKDSDYSSLGDVVTDVFRNSADRSRRFTRRAQSGLLGMMKHRQTRVLRFAGRHSPIRSSELDLLVFIRQQCVGWPGRADFEAMLSGLAPPFTLYFISRRPVNAVDRRAPGAKIAGPATKGENDDG